MADGLETHVQADDIRLSNTTTLMQTTSWNHVNPLTMIFVGLLLVLK